MVRIAITAESHYRRKRNMARKGRRTAKHIWKRIPKELRPTWEEFKQATYYYGGARTAELAILQSAVMQMEKDSDHRAGKHEDS